MTVFDEVLTAEKEAEKTIVSAKATAREEITEAKVKQKTRLTDEENKLIEVEKKADETFKKQISETVLKFETEAKAQVAAIEHKFLAQKENLKQMILSSF